MSQLRLNSSRIDWVEYDEESKELTIQFRRGGKYKYYEVEQEDMNGFLGHPSPGKGFEIYIKPQYVGVKQ